jgi:hypothetical protein
MKSSELLTSEATVLSPPRPAMSEDTKSLHATHKPDVKQEDPPQTVAPVELTAMVLPRL